MTARRRTSIHEAGHAVADVVLGIPIKYASIRPGKTFRGIAAAVPSQFSDVDRFDPFRPVSTQPAALRADIERYIIAALAGDIAALTLYEPSVNGESTSHVGPIPMRWLAGRSPTSARG